MSTANYLMMIPFSIEKLSVGSPAMFQSLIFTGSPKVPVTEKSFEHGMLVSRQAFTHSAVCCWQEKREKSFCDQELRDLENDGTEGDTRQP